CPAAGAHRLPAVTAVPPGLCGVGLGSLRDGGGHVAEAGGPVGLPVPLGNVGTGGQVADALLHFGFPSLVPCDRHLTGVHTPVSTRPDNLQVGETDHPHSGVGAVQSGDHATAGRPLDVFDVPGQVAGPVGEERAGDDLDGVALADELRDRVAADEVVAERVGGLAG